MYVTIRVKYLQTLNPMEDLWGVRYKFQITNASLYGMTCMSWNPINVRPGYQLVNPVTSFGRMYS